MAFKDYATVDTLGWRVRQRRKMLGIRQTVLAHECELSQSTLSHIELGRVTEPSYHTYRVLAAALHCAPAWLIKGKREDAPAGFYTPYIQEDQE